MPPRHRRRRQAQSAAHRSHAAADRDRRASARVAAVLFRYVLGGAVRVPGGSYVDYVVPAIFLEAVLIGGMTTSIGLAQDLKSGIIDRFRSLPMARSAVLAGRTLADLSRSLLSLAIMIGLGLLVGFHFHSDAGSIIAGMALVITFGYAFSWLYAAIGLATKGPRDRPGRRHPPLLHPDCSRATPSCPWRRCPAGCRASPRNQPLSVTIAAVRALLEGGPAAHWVWQSLAWSAGIFIVFFAISLHLYRNNTS